MKNYQNSTNPDGPRQFASTVQTYVFTSGTSQEESPRSSPPESIRARSGSSNSLTGFGSKVASDTPRVFKMRLQPRAVLQGASVRDQAAATHSLGSVPGSHRTLEACSRCDCNFHRDNVRAYSPPFFQKSIIDDPSRSRPIRSSVDCRPHHLLIDIR